MNVNEVIDRLKKSKGSETESNSKAGKAAGSEWASQFAEYSELRNLERFHDDVGFDSLTRERSDDDLTADYEFACAILGDAPSAYEFAGFCDYAFGDGSDVERFRQSPDYIFGFATGALEVWNQVKDKI